MFTIAIKCMLVLFMLAGIAATFYATLEIRRTVSFVQTSTGRSKATFAGYHREIHKSGGMTKRSYSVATYPEFTYHTHDGKTERVRESKVHVIAIYKPGDEVEILFNPPAYPRLADFYSLYVRDVLILAIGLLALIFSLAFWNYALPRFASLPAAHESTLDPTSALASKHESSGQASSEIETVFRDAILSVLDFQIGPIKLRHILYGFGGFFLLVIALLTVQGLAPFVSQMRFGDRGRMLEAFAHQRYDEVSAMIVKGKGIHVRNEFNQNPLLLALEARKQELARMLIEAGADVNIKSKMYKTPILVATKNGDLEMVRLLISYGAKPDTTWDEEPAVFYAIAKGYDDIARELIKASTDLGRRYQYGKETITVEDFARAVNKPELVKLIRKRHGKDPEIFLQSKDDRKKIIQPRDNRRKDAAQEQIPQPDIKRKNMAGKKFAAVEKAEHKDINETDAARKVKKPSPSQSSPVMKNRVEEKAEAIPYIRDTAPAADTQVTEEKKWESFTGKVKEIDRDDRFIAFNNGVVKDTQTGLMWACRDNGSDIAWEEAKTYCENFKRAGYTDWRMPTLKEMKMIHGTGEPYPLKCKPSQSVQITRLIALTCSYPWTIERSQKLAISFDFCRKLRRSCPVDETENHRVLPVRNYK
jgi:hypothetical protein